MPARPYRLYDRLAWSGRAARLVLEDPVEGLDRALLRLIPPREARGPRRCDVVRTSTPRLHALLDVGWPCPSCEGFETAFGEAMARIERAGHGFGRGAFGGWDDADPALARTIWCLAMHLRPQVVVETGVARGVTTSVILEVLRRHRRGHLWSIDRPPLDPQLHSQIGVAVPPALRTRWTLVRGTSRRLLPAVLRRVGQIDLFVHDSLHTERNVRFELTHAWRALRPGGALVVDDVERNVAFEQFADAHRVRSLVAAADDGRSTFGIALSPAA